jgi:hypothetical protein
LKCDDRQPAIAQISSSAVAASAPPSPAEGGDRLDDPLHRWAEDSAWRLADYLEGLKDMKAYQEGTRSSFAASSLWFFLLTLQCSGFVALTAELAAMRKALFEEKAARSTADRTLAEEKAAQQTVEQSLQSSDKAKVLLEQELESNQASLTATSDKLSSKSTALDTAMIQERKMKI